MEIYRKDPQSELSVVLKEIMSLHKERRELLSSLTPGVSEWKGLGQPKPLLAANNFTPASVKEMERSSTPEQLGWYLDSISHDMDDLVHRMLSMAYVVVKPDGAALSTCIADELVSSTSRLKDACKELYTDTKDAYRDSEKEVPEYALSAFCHRFLSSPLEFENKLTLVITKEMEENYRKEVEKERKRVWELRKENVAHFLQWEKEQKKMEKKEQKRMEKKKGKEMKKKGKEMEKKGKEKKGLEKHKDLYDEFMDHDEYKDLDQSPYQETEENLNLDPNTLEYLEKGVEAEEKFFADDRDAWNSTWGSKSTRCGDFRDKTTLSPMHFTHYTKDAIQSSCGVTGSTLEIYSIKIELKVGLKWPVKLYGMVAARDTVDRNLNIVFSRSSLDHQELGENDSLCLTGPSRAIVALDYVDFEVELKIKEGEESQGKELMTLSKRYDGTGTSLMFENKLCKVELKLKHLSKALQATVVGVSVVEGGEWPFEYGCKVACSLGAAADEVVLFDCRGDSKSKEVRVGSAGYLHLSRNVVSVPSEGTLGFTIYTYSRSGSSKKYCTSFRAEECRTMEKELAVGTSKVKIVVAWSLLVKEKLDLLVDCPAVET